MDIDFKDFGTLQLSARKRAELTQYMKVFTQPLINRIYGGGTGDVKDMSHIVQKIAQPDRREALRNLEKMANELSITIPEVPAFLERYGDVFLSLSYFRNCLDLIMVDVEAFNNWLQPVNTCHEVMVQPANVATLDMVRTDLENTTTSVVGRFEFFNHRTQDFWTNINADTFREFRDLVVGHHVSMGTVLTGLSVKMRLWKERFPNGGGAPIKRMEFVRSEVVPGLNKIREAEEAAVA